MIELWSWRSHGQGLLAGLRVGEFFKPVSASLGGSSFTPTALEIIAPEAFCEVDSGRKGPLKAWLEVFTISEMAMGDESTIKVQTAFLYTALWEDIDVGLRAQDKMSRAAASFVDRPHLPARIRRRQSMWVRWVSQVRAALGPTSLLSHLGHRGKHRSFGFVVFSYVVTPLIADGVAAAGRVQRRQASGS